ncbi:MAG: hypothetical protein M3373_02890 [Gemmatimonadota bacterium]|nr:hypothetical protein [Gemmatimonadota bacterium]
MSATLDARERFLRAIAQHVAAERITELHLFSPLRQGGRETGIAVVAAISEEEHQQAELPVAVGDAAPGKRESPMGRALAERLVVYRAAYRWTRKGPDRGKWEVDVTAEADATLEAVGSVVRGVHRRAGGDAEPERLSGVEVRAAISDSPWTTAT